MEGTWHNIRSTYLSLYVHYFTKVGAKSGPSLIQVNNSWSQIEPCHCFGSSGDGGGWHRVPPVLVPSVMPDARERTKEKADESTVWRCGRGKSRDSERERGRDERATASDGRTERVVESARPSVRVRSSVCPSDSERGREREKGKEKRATKDKAANQMDDASIHRRRRYSLPPSLRLRTVKVPVNSVIWLTEVLIAR